MRRITIFILLLVSLSACNAGDSKSDKKTIFVTITPLRSIIAEMTCNDFDIEVLVPEGASPETYDPTAQQLTAANDADMLFSIGLIDFEQQLVERLNSDSRIVNLSEGIEVMAGCCAHSHHHHHHKHGIDPHIWTSPRALKSMVETAHRAIKATYPDSAKYDTATARLLERIEELDSYCERRIEEADVNVMMIYHPAYTYYARDYGIRQIAIEQDGKEPSPRQLTELVELAEEESVKTIFIQPQYDVNKVGVVAEECDAEVIVTDPLAEDILLEIKRLTDIICSEDE